MAGAILDSFNPRLVSININLNDVSSIFFQNILSFFKRTTLQNDKTMIINLIKMASMTSDYRLLGEVMYCLNDSHDIVCLVVV
jgi:hypothetical protein